MRDGLKTMCLWGDDRDCGPRGGLYQPKQMETVLDKQMVLYVQTKHDKKIKKSSKTRVQKSPLLTDDVAAGGERKL